MLGSILILLGVFLVWQFKMFKKYMLEYDRFKLDIPSRYILVNQERIIFEEIDFITVQELEQPSVLEKTFSKSAARAYMARVMFHLKNGYRVDCTFNRKRELYSTLKQLEPFVPVRGNIEDFKPSINWVAVFILLIILGFFFLMML